jgi:hypothetical protein
MLKIRMRLLGYFKRWFVVRREARGYVWSGKASYAFLLMLVTFRPTAGEAAAIRDVVIPANASQPRIVAELWTPCSTPAPEMLIAAVAAHGTRPWRVDRVIVGPRK